MDDIEYENVDLGEYVEFTLLVNDYLETIEFYCDTLGIFEAPDRVGQIDADNVRLFFRDPSIRLILGLTLASKAQCGHQCGDSAFAIFPVADIDNLAERVAARGISLGRGIQGTPWGARLLRLHDNVGNLIVLSQFRRKRSVKRR